MKVNIPKFECKRCSHKWSPRQSEIRMCPKCKSPYWDTPKKTGGKTMKTILILLTLSVPCFSDEVLLKDGRRIDFKSLEDTGETYTIVTPEGVRMVVKRSEVTGFEKTEPVSPLTGATMSFGKKDKLDSVDLLKKVETDKDFLAGAWKFQQDGSLLLTAPAVVEHGTCQIRYTPASEEYNLTLTMERTEGDDNIGVTLQIPGGRQCQYYFDIQKGKCSAILVPGGPDGHTKASAPAPGRQFAVKKPHTVVFMVRRAGLVVQVDGKDVTTFRSDWTNVEPLGGPKVGGAQDKGAFAISALASGIRISKAVLTQKP